MDTTQKLGSSAFRFMFIENVFAGAVLFILGVAGLAGRGAISRGLPLGALGFDAQASATIVRDGAIALVCIGILLAIVGAVAAWIAYAFSTFSLDEYALRIRRGFLNKREILIPYRQIQDVDINRSVLFRIMGVSELVILTAGRDNEAKREEAEGVFNIVDAALAEKLQTELTRRASVQMVSQAPAGADGNAAGV